MIFLLFFVSTTFLNWLNYLWCNFQRISDKFNQLSPKSGLFFEISESTNFISLAYNYELEIIEKFDVDLNEFMEHEDFLRNHVIKFDNEESLRWKNLSSKIQSEHVTNHAGNKMVFSSVEIDGDDYNCIFILTFFLLYENMDRCFFFIFYNHI